MPIHSSGPPSITFRKLMIFIDGSNFLYGVANYQKKISKNYKINCDALLKILIEQSTTHGLIRPEYIKAYYYGPQGTPEDVKSLRLEESFNTTVEQFKKDLERLHVKLILKERIKGKEKNIDAALVTDFLALAYSGAYDYALLVSGDADFISAIDEVKRFGKIVFIASFKDDFNEELMQHIDKIIFLEAFTASFLEEIKSA